MSAYHRLAFRLFSIFVLLALIFAQPKRVEACICRSAKTELDRLNRAEVAFIGKVTQISPALSGGFDIALDIDYKIKNVSTSAITVYTGTGAGDCGSKFEIGKQYLIYAYTDTGRLETNICTGSRETNLDDLLTKYFLLASCITSSIAIALITLMAWAKYQRSQVTITK